MNNFSFTLSKYLLGRAEHAQPQISQSTDKGSNQALSDSGQSK
jgi:hypothetical protein